MITLYDVDASGNCHKVRLFLSLLDVEYASRPVNLMEGEHNLAPFLQMNPFAQVPVLVDGDVLVRDSQAILVYLAQQYGNQDWLPTHDPNGMAQIMAWLSTAANEVARGPNDLRLHYKFGRQLDLAAAGQTCERLYGIVEQQLQASDWLVGDHITIADIAVYPYIALSPEGQIDLVPYPGLRQWLERIQALPGYVGMPGMYSAAEQ
ncbi:glutathione S-transferase family protein [Advenella mimigardefordensis]|uniref:Putative glutathione S-transferase n=1 Tax=Advenella mimigardefordensis (strain DSM 17166 / LMG 22922 / DPN7) TaxID=1247726 RepID=W0PE96_ADVMD|nr:glutathione S-transferase [Advenella mimigardefordensis]AHG63797.1 putative glutathione S-transferase [Advenella mimigardefordensis DPN7]